MDNNQYGQPPSYAPAGGDKTGAYPPPAGAYPPPGSGPNYAPWQAQNPPAGGAYPATKGDYPAGGANPSADGAYPTTTGGTYVANPQTQVNVVYAQDEVARVQDYMIANILACLCCCWCIGIAAIWKSNECQNAKQARNLEAARSFSDTAKKLLIATIVCGIVIYIVGVVVRVVVYSTASKEVYVYTG